jgi:hypothetical protein
LTEFEQAVIDAGVEVEATARGLFPCGILIAATKTGAQQKTAELLNANSRTLSGICLREWCRESAENPYITFRSTKITQTGPPTFELNGDFIIRVVTGREKLKLTDSGKDSPSGSIFGTMAF